MTRNTLLFSTALIWVTACNASEKAVAPTANLARQAVERPSTALPDADVPASGTPPETGDSLIAAITPDPSKDTLVDSLESVTELAPSIFEIDTHPSFELRRGETLAHFSRWSGVPVERIADASGLDLDGQYDVGLEIVVPISQQDLVEVNEAREAHRTKRVEGYLASRGGAVRSDFYTVKTGDTAWSIAKTQQAVPLWIIESYNPAIDLDRLRPGQELMIPVLADTVADAQ
jgi:hypothetical protein